MANAYRDTIYIYHKSHYVGSLTKYKDCSSKRGYPGKIPTNSSHITPNESIPTSLTQDYHAQRQRRLPVGCPLLGELGRDLSPSVIFVVGNIIFARHFPSPLL